MRSQSHCCLVPRGKALDWSSVIHPSSDSLFFIFYCKENFAQWCWNGGAYLSTRNLELQLSLSANKNSTRHLTLITKINHDSRALKKEFTYLSLQSIEFRS